MKKILLTVFGSLLALNLVFAQASIERFVVASAGGSYTNGSTLSVDYTIGEVAVTTVSGATNILTQGFQQPFTNLLVSVPESSSKELSITAWPNPAVNRLDVRINSGAGLSVGAHMYDVLGRAISHSNGVTSAGGFLQLTFDMEDLATGYYYLRIEAGSTVKSMKILKLDPQ